MAAIIAVENRRRRRIDHTGQIALCFLCDFCVLLRLLLFVISSSLRMHLEVAAGKDFVSSVSSSHSRDPQLAGVSCRPRPLTRRTGYVPLFDRDL